LGHQADAVVVSNPPEKNGLVCHRLQPVVSGPLSIVNRKAGFSRTSSGAMALMSKELA
jgi:hypothetical protein